jgi:hypothetical protein
MPSDPSVRPISGARCTTYVVLGRAWASRTLIIASNVPDGIATGETLTPPIPVPLTAVSADW